MFKLTTEGDVLLTDAAAEQITHGWLKDTPVSWYTDESRQFVKPEFRGIVGSIVWVASIRFFGSRDRVIGPSLGWEVKWLRQRVKRLLAGFPDPGPCPKLLTKEENEQ